MVIEVLHRVEVQKPCFRRAFCIDGKFHRDSARQGEDYQT